MSRKGPLVEPQRLVPETQHASPAEQRLAAARQHQRAGRIREAEQLYRQILMVDPRHPDSLHTLGGIAAQTGRHDLAEDLMRQAIAIAPDIALYHASLGDVLQASGRSEDALACY